jgi:2-desacetyl-2-hydroxyethyl bacteriochlorophyllide A dehydrogenase
MVDIADADRTEVQQIWFDAIGSVTLKRETKDLAPGPKEVLIRPAFVGICGTDLHVLHGNYRVKPPVLTGHEASAIISAVGSDVAGFARGDRVVVNPVAPCGHCSSCRTGQPNICVDAVVMGFRIPGLAQTAMLVPQERLHRIPANLPLECAALAEPLSVAVHAVGRARDLDNILVIGGGTIGTCVVLAALALGAKSITIVEPIAAKRDFLLALGCSAALGPDAPLETTYTSVFDIVSSTGTLNAAIRACIPGGDVVVVGSPKSDVSLDFSKVMRFEVSILGSAIFVPADMDRAIDILAAAPQTFSRIISRVFPLQAASASYSAALDSTNIKTLIKMNCDA